MRRRLLTVYLTLLAVALVGLAIPLSLSLVSRASQAVAIDRARDNARFASLAEPALRTGRLDAVTNELRRYDELFGIAAMILNRDGAVTISSRDALPLDDPAVREVIEAALSGERVSVGAPTWPWQASLLVTGEPVGRGGEIIGAAITISPTADLRAQAWQTWGLIAAASALVLLLGAGAGRLFVRWILRPVDDLGEAVAALADGQLRVRVPRSLGPAELQQLTTSFNNMADRVATLVERQRTFVSYASHQLRGPIGILSLGVDNLEPSLTPQAQDDYQLVKGEVGRLTRMCDSLLSYARAEDATGDATMVDLAALATARVRAWESTAHRAGIRLERTGLAPIYAHTVGETLSMALDALIENAIKFAGAGSTVTVAVRQDPTGSVNVHVIDDGPGMSVDELKRAVQPFWRRPDHQNIEGSGLGAAIAEALVRASGGTLSYQQAPVRGVNVCIRLRPAERS